MVHRALSSTALLGAVLVVIPALAQVEQRSLMSRINPLSPSAGKYAAYLDVCTDSGGDALRSEFESRAEGLSESNKATVFTAFDKARQNQATRLNSRLERKPDYCQSSRAQRIKVNYQADLQRFQRSAPAQPSPEPSVAASSSPVAASSPPIATSSSPIAPITRADLDGVTGTIGNPMQFAKNDATIAACGGGRDPMIRTNVVMMIGVMYATGGQSGVNRATESYDNLFASTMRLKERFECQGDNPERSYAQYQDYQDMVLERAAGLRAARDNPPDPAERKQQGASAQEACKDTSGVIELTECIDRFYGR